MRLISATSICLVVGAMTSVSAYPQSSPQSPTSADDRVILLVNPSAANGFGRAGVAIVHDHGTVIDYYSFSRGNPYALGIPLATRGYHFQATTTATGSAIDNLLTGHATEVNPPTDQLPGGVGIKAATPSEIASDLRQYTEALSTSLNGSNAAAKMLREGDEAIHRMYNLCQYNCGNLAEDIIKVDQGLADALQKATDKGFGLRSDGVGTAVVPNSLLNFLTSIHAGNRINVLQARSSADHKLSTSAATAADNSREQERRRHLPPPAMIDQ